jgi:hypothetical protein
MFLLRRPAFNWGSSSLTCRLHLLVLLVVLLPLHLWAQNPSWQAALTNAATDLGRITPRNVANDGAGNVYVAGSFVGTVQLGATTLISTAGSNRLPGNDAFVAKWSATTNTWVWALGGGPAITTKQPTWLWEIMVVCT